jgi:hypothetical protein
MLMMMKMMVMRMMMSDNETTMMDYDKLCRIKTPLNMNCADFRFCHAAKFKTPVAKPGQEQNSFLRVDGCELQNSVAFL